MAASGTCDYGVVRGECFELDHRNCTGGGCQGRAVQERSGDLVTW